MNEPTHMNPNILFAIYCVVYLIFIDSNISIFHIIKFIGYSIYPVGAIILYNIKKENRTIKIAAYVGIAAWMIIAIGGNLARFLK